MELKTIIGTYWQWLLTAVFAVAVFCFWLFWLPQLMLAREQMQLFLWNTDYLMERLAVPGGLAQYLGEFIVQFFLNPVSGALCYALLFVAAQLLCWRIQRSLFTFHFSLLSYLLSFLIPCVLWYVACVPDIPLTPVVAVVLTLGLMNLLPKARKARWAAVCVMVPVGYWLLGPAIVLLTVMFIPSVLLLALCLFASAWVTPYPLRQIARGIDYYWEGDKVGTLEEMTYDVLMRRHLWTEMADRYQAKPTESLAIRNAVHLALYNQHRISREELMIGLTLSNQTLKSVSSAFLMSEVSLPLGMVNLSQRSAFEAMEAIPNYNKSARALHRLVETNIITGQYDVARKYIAILEETTFYRGWAKKMSLLIEQPEQIRNYPLYQRLKEMYDNGEDGFFY